MSRQILLGDEAVALAAIHAGITQAYGYPGTPSTEIMEYLQEHRERHGTPFAVWGSNEKTAYEEAIGASFAGRRVLVTMKHVGLNVAADPFVNSALLDLKGGLVLAVADDPGMHSSQDEQDSRFFADFARVICLEPVNQQQAYDMTREAFDLSEKYKIPVMIRLVTRLSHSRAAVETGEARQQNPLEKAADPTAWQLIPAWARRQWKKLLDLQPEFMRWAENHPANTLTLVKGAAVGVITTGLGRNYFMENLPEMADKPSHLHIGTVPAPEDKIRALAASVKKIVVLEEGNPFVERFLRGYLPQGIVINGKLDGSVPLTGELDPDTIRPALGLAPRAVNRPAATDIPGRPPQLCKGCPHEDTFNFIKEATGSFEKSIVTSDIGCYALGSLPPYSATETIICMGASITVAKGAAEAGHPHVCGVIGDSTFLHSGLTGLVDCVAHKAPVTIIIVDNDTVGMTGGQQTILPSNRLKEIVLGIGVEPEHFHVVPAHRKNHAENTGILKKELEYNGVSVIIAVRECIEHMRKKKSLESA
jgi:indolepyruvate ferredoxin oxidoreductase alpha subunit